ncbi:MAG: hypothetical protein MUP17_12390 [candidate division Zixibacteria bacterium]|nr:hypothetical protein [candidate division Zixibacteria bacterium]
MIEEEKQKLKVFLYRAQELKNRRLFKDGYPKHFLEVYIGKKIGYKTIFPDEDDFRSMLIDFRTFLLQDEPNHFYSICNLLHTKLESDELKKQIAEIRASFKTALEESYIGQTFIDKEFNPEENLHYWLNELLFHTGQKKNVISNRFNESKRPLLKYDFVTTVLDLSEYIFTLSTVISQILQE